MTALLLHPATTALCGLAGGTAIGRYFLPHNRSLENKVVIDKDDFDQVISKAVTEAMKKAQRKPAA